MMSLDDTAHYMRNQQPKHQLQISSLLQPLERYMLPYLPLEVMANLRASCRTLRCLIDDAPAEAWQLAASDALLPKCLQHASRLCVDSSDVQLRLQFQGSTISSIRNGAPSWRRKHFPHEDDEMQATGVQWAPGWPSPYIAMLLRRPDSDEEGRCNPGRCLAARHAHMAASGGYEPSSDNWELATGKVVAHFR